MATTDVLLLQPIDGLGDEGEHARVKAGYARNYLFPRKIAVPMTRANRKQIESLQKAREARKAKELDYAQEVAERIRGAHIAIAVQTGPGGKMFGSVTAADLQRRLEEDGIKIDRKQIQLYNPVRSLGSHTTRFRLHPEITVELEWEVVSENPIEDESGEGEEESPES